MNVELEITDQMIEKSIDKIVKQELDKYFGRDAWTQYGNYNDVLTRVVNDKVNKIFTSVKISSIIDEKKNDIAARVADNITERIIDALSN